PQAIPRLLCGEPRVAATLADGANDTLYPPRLSATPAYGPQDQKDHEPVAEEEQIDFDPELLLKSEIDDDRHSIEQGDRVVLIVEDDVEFAKTELELARMRGFKGIAATRGHSAVALAHEYHPDATILD